MAPICFPELPKGRGTVLAASHLGSWCLLGNGCRCGRRPWGQVEASLFRAVLGAVAAVPWRVCGSPFLMGSPHMTWKVLERCRWVTVNICKQRGWVSIIFIGCGKAPAVYLIASREPITFHSLRINWLILQSALEVQSTVKCSWCKQSPHVHSEGKGAEGAVAGSLHSKFHDCFWKLCFLIYKSCQRNKLNGITRWP